MAGAVVEKRPYKGLEFVELEHARASGSAFSLTILQEKGKATFT